MTKKELLNLLQDVSDDTEIFIDGYQGGFTKPKMKIKSLYYAPAQYCGEYNEWFSDDADGYDGIPLKPVIKNAVILTRMVD